MLKKRKVWYLGLIIGMIAGTVYVNINWYKSSDAINTYLCSFNRTIVTKDMIKSELQYFIFESRLKEMFIIFVFNMTFLGSAFNCIYMFYMGGTSAIVSSMMALRYGYNALYYFGMSVFPYYIVYMGMVLFTMTFCSNIKDRRLKKGMSGSIIVNFCIIMLLIWTESMLEAYVRIDFFK